MTEIGKPSKISTDLLLRIDQQDTNRLKILGLVQYATNHLNIRRKGVPQNRPGEMALKTQIRERIHELQGLTAATYLISGG